MPIETLEITNEEDAWRILEQAVQGSLSETAMVSFENWPRFQLTLKGEDFHGTVPTRVMPPILELQKNIHRAYCQARYGTDDIRVLKNIERERLELVVEVQNGSSHFIVQMAETLNEIVKSSHMTGIEVVITVLGVGIVWSASVGWKQWLASNERKHAQDVTVRLSQQETERVNILQRTTESNRMLSEASENMDEFRSGLAKQLKDEDRINANDTYIIDGARATEIVSAPRQTAQEIRLDGEYRINEVKFPEQFGGEYRFSVRESHSDKNFIVTAAPQVLSEEQINILQEGGFKVKPVFMKINARELRGVISSAKLVSISWNPEPRTS